ncbi:unnamed protein product [Alopecurus aequalis]
MDELVEEVLLRFPPVLMDELIEEVLLRLPPPGSSAPPLSASRGAASTERLPSWDSSKSPPGFVPTSALLPALPDSSCWIAATAAPFSPPMLLLVPGTTRSPRASPSWTLRRATSAACPSRWTAGSGSVRRCSALHKAVTTTVVKKGNSLWSEVISIPAPNVMYDCNIHVPSVSVGTAVYFNSQDIVKYQLGTRCLSMFEKPTYRDGALMTAEDGGLGFAAVVDDTNLSIWSRETGPEGAVGWVKLRVIDLERLLPGDAHFIPTHEYEISWFPPTLVSGAVEGTQVIFVSTEVGCYMVDLKSGRAKKFSPLYGEYLFPYTRFYIPGRTQCIELPHCTGSGEGCQWQALPSPCAMRGDRDSNPGPSGHRRNGSSFYGPRAKARVA